jgi:hypothetical protein
LIVVDHEQRSGWPNGHAGSLADVLPEAYIGAGGVVFLEPLQQQKKSGLLTSRPQRLKKLNQEKTREDMDKLEAQLERRREGHQLKVDAWEREL